ncbi:MAG: helix-turn-helix domain-containing protein [Lachnospiraceae bacterium]
MTKLGKILKHIRIENDEVLGDMAIKIGVSSAFLSKVENGLAKPSDKVLNNVLNRYQLSDLQKKELQEAFYDQRGEAIISFQNLTQREKQVAICFAQLLPEMDEKTLDAITDIMKS